MALTEEFVNRCRRQFPALNRRVGEHQAVYFDGPGGTQTPQRVIDAISHYLSHHNANHGGAFLTSAESDAVLEESHRAAADFLGADDADTVVFGANMTSLTFALSRALAKEWKPKDEVIVTHLDHDANVTPWKLAAQDAGAIAHQVRFHPEDGTFDLDDFRAKLSDRTRLVAVGCASNATGGINPIEPIVEAAHQAGALVYLDAVHHAPHALIDVKAYDCDFLACSAYKFFGPHIGLLWGRRELLERLPAYKVRPAPNSPPDRWMTGTQSHECIAGAMAAIEYLADLGRGVANDAGLSRRAALQAAYRAIGEYERSLAKRVLDGLASLEEIHVYGLTDTARLSDRHPTFSFTHRRLSPQQMAQRLGESGIFTWHGNYYALSFTEALDLEPDGMLRVGLVHYNTEQEVDRLLEQLQTFSQG